MIALIDGDIFCYRIGFATDKEPEGVAIRTMAKVLEDMLMFGVNCSKWRTYLTGHSNYRHDYAVTAPYKGNRKGEKPIHYTLLREYLQYSWNGDVYNGIEADDAIAIEATKFGDESITISLDKDFDQVHRIDNIMGVRGIGPVKARKLLEGKTEQEMFDICCEELGSLERATENGILLYLQRKEGEIWSPPSEDTLSKK